MDLGLDLARADARALGEDQDVLAALQRMLGGAQALHVGGATLHGNAAHAAKGPAYDLALGELGLKDGADARPPKNSAVSTAKSSAIEVWLQMTTLPRPSWRSNSRSASSTFQRHMSLEKAHRMAMTTTTVPRMSAGNSA